VWLVIRNDTDTEGALCPFRVTHSKGKTGLWIVRNRCFTKSTCFWHHYRMLLHPSYGSRYELPVDGDFNRDLEEVVSMWECNVATG
jgi:hypothetical protein